MRCPITLATRVTLLRILLVPFFVVCLLAYRPDREHLRWVALFIFTAAVLSDGLDGLLARNLSQHSALGRLLDPLADKLLLLTAFVSCAFLTGLPDSLRIPSWVALLVIGRDLFIVLGSGFIFLAVRHFEIRPSRLGKATTFFQMSTVLSVLLGLSVRAFFWNAASVLTIASGLGYLHYGSRLLTNRHA